MIELTMTLGEQVDGSIHLRVGDETLLEATLYDNDGTDWAASYETTLIVRRTYNDSGGQIEIPELTETTPGGDNIYYFDLSDITFEPGVYEAYVFVEGTYDVLTTPFDDSASFESFTITVTA